MSQLLAAAARHYAARDHKAAESVCRTILALDPRNFDALHLLGVVLTQQDRPAEALPYLRRAQAQQPDQVQLQINLGNALLATQRYQDAIETSRAADPQTLNNLGLAYRGLLQHAQAAAAFRGATDLRWDYAPAWFNLATTLAKLGRLEDALQAATTTLRVAPLDTPIGRLADATNEVGRILMELGRPREALATCRAFLKRHAEQQTVIWNTSLALLLLGDFTHGWPAYEARFDVPGHDRRPEGAVVLDPARVAGKRVLILTEQGRGDMLQFIRYAPMLTAKGARVTVQAYPDLVPLLDAMPSIEAVVSTDAPRPPADLITSIMSLPLAFNIHPDAMPYPRTPYLAVPRARQSASLGPRTRTRIGLAWSGSPESYDRAAMPAQTLAPLLAQTQFEFHCLQKSIVPEDQAWLETENPPIIRHKLEDFADTAALIDQMDVIVSIDTAVAHLAGALAKPLFVLLPFAPDWRWQLNRNDTPWYPTARLVRQPRGGAWPEVIQAAMTALG